MVRKYLLSLSKGDGIVNTTVVNAIAKALISKYAHLVVQVDVDSSCWAQSLFSRMNFVKRSKTSSKIEFLYLHDIVSKIEKYDIPSALVVNINQALLKYVPVGNERMAAKREHSVTIEGSADKSSITGTFPISIDGNFFPVQLIYGGKTTQSLPRFEFPKDFNLSTNPKNVSNTDEWLKFLKEVIKPYVTKQRQILKYSADQKALVIMDVFTGEMKTAVMHDALFLWFG